MKIILAHRQSKEVDGRGKPDGLRQAQLRADAAKYAGERPPRLKITLGGHVTAEKLIAFTREVIEM